MALQFPKPQGKKSTPLAEGDFLDAERSMLDLYGTDMQLAPKLVHLSLLPVEGLCAVLHWLSCGVALEFMSQSLRPHSMGSNCLLLGG